MFDINKCTTELKYILRRIYEVPGMINVLEFKGGTACYIFYGLKRDSVDLDFTLLSLDKEKFVIDTIKNILEERGKFATPVRVGGEETIHFNYRGSQGNIKIEVSKKQYKEGEKYDLKSYENINIPVMSKENMFSHKLIAITKRTGLASRDLFDIGFFFNNKWEFNKSIIEERSGKSVSLYFEELINFIDKNFNEKNILDGLGELIDSNTKADTKKNLKNDVIFQLRSYISNRKYIIVQKGKDWLYIDLESSCLRIPRYSIYQSIFTPYNKKSIFIAITHALLTRLQLDLDIKDEEFMEWMIVFLYQFKKIKDSKEEIGFIIGSPYGEMVNIHAGIHESKYMGLGENIRGIFKGILGIQNDKDLRLNIKWKILLDILYYQKQQSLNYGMINIVLYTTLFDIKEEYLSDMINEMKVVAFIEQINETDSLYNMRFTITSKGDEVLKRGLMKNLEIEQF